MRDPYDGGMDDERDRFEEEGPLAEDEIEALQQDLVDVQTLKSLLGPRGIKGTVFFCPDCNEDHYLGWDLLTGNLKELLSQGESPIHEPAFDPDPDEYVSWDYARGFLDGYESYEQEELAEMGDRLTGELVDRGWPLSDVKGLLARVGLDLEATEEDDDEETE
jgi:hypothetical protein